MLEVIGRLDAAALNRRRYYTGRPCMRGHVCERWVCNTGCVECANPLNRPSADGALASGLTAELVWHTVRLKVNRTLTDEQKNAFSAQVQGWWDHLSEEAGIASLRYFENI